MSYEPTVWQAGDTVTSAKLNKIEQGIAGGGNMILHGSITQVDIEPPTIEVTEDVSSIFQAIENGSLVRMDALWTYGRLIIAYLADYRMPTESYSGHLYFATIPELYQPSQAQTSIRQDVIEWREEEGWTFNSFDVIVNFQS